jgi:hypothetical protein
MRTAEKGFLNLMEHLDISFGRKITQSKADFVLIIKTPSKSRMAEQRDPHSSKTGIRFIAASRGPRVTGRRPALFLILSRLYTTA